MNALDLKISALQKKIVDKFKNRFHKHVSPLVMAAFHRQQRHKFIDEFFHPKLNTWITLNEQNLEEYLPIIYSDRPLTIFHSNGSGMQEVPTPIFSTISQPSFVLELLHMLDLHPGQKVYEVGTGSAWNAAMMADIVGEEGHVWSTEVIQELVNKARTKVFELGITNLDIHYGDGIAAIPKDQIFNRVIFTAASESFPHALFGQVALGGKVLFIFKTSRIADLAILLNKKTDCFASEKMILCHFVPTLDLNLTHKHLSELEFGYPFDPLSHCHMQTDELNLKIYPDNKKLHPGEQQFLTHLDDAQYLWTVGCE